MFFAEFAILFIYGPEFQESVGIFHVLMGGFLATLISHPLFLIFYAMNKPQIGVFISFVSLVGWLIAAVILIPNLGVIGAAWAMLVSRLIQAVAITVILWQHLTRRLVKSALN